MVKVVQIITSVRYSTAPLTLQIYTENSSMPLRTNYFQNIASFMELKRFIRGDLVSTQLILKKNILDTGPIYQGIREV
jgi:hypothetical protein